MPKPVLIVEDEHVLLRNLSNTLLRAGIDTVCAASFAEAQDKLSSCDVSLICVDLQLGDGNGIDLLRNVRAQNSNIPLVVMTGQDSVANRMRAEEVDVSAFLAKPFALARFRELLKTLLLHDATDNTTLSGPSVLMYSHDTIGLGHMRRNSNIATEIVRLMPDVSVLMLVGSPSGVVFDLPAGVDFIKLPSLAKVSRDVWQPASLRVSANTARDIRSGLIERAVETFRPDVVLVDHEPAGVWDELVPALDMVKQNPDRPQVVLGLRDILDEPQSTRAQWARRGIDGLLTDHYDEVLIYGDRTIFPSDRLYGLDHRLDGRVHYCGYVTGRRGERPVRTSLPESAPRIIVSGGGGRDACPMLHAVLAGLSLLPDKLRKGSTIIAGPLMDAELRSDLESRASDLGVGFLVSTPDLPGLLASADLFVTMGGYNALTEAASVGCPTVVIPRIGPSAEQRMRAKLFAERGYVEAMALDEATPDRLAERFGNVQRGAAHRPTSLPLGGARRAAEHIVGMLARRHPQTTMSQARSAAHG